MNILTVHKAGPSLTVQDLGRKGYRAVGLSKGGATDVEALFELDALLGSQAGTVAIEMPQFGGEFSISEPTVFAVTGADMVIEIDGKNVSTYQTHKLSPGERLKIGAATNGSIGYLGFSGGILTKTILNARATHITAGIGGLLSSGDQLPLGSLENGQENKGLKKREFSHNNVIHILPSFQSELFSQLVRDRFEQTSFVINSARNRQGITIDCGGENFSSGDHLNVVSDIMSVGDIQITGDGAPFVALSECQTIGGFPRIGCVIESDIAKIAQMQTGASLRFKFIDFEEAEMQILNWRAKLTNYKKQIFSVVRDPRNMSDLMSYQLISGAITGWEE